MKGSFVPTLAIKLVPSVPFLVQNVLFEADFGIHQLERTHSGHLKKITTGQNTNKIIHDTPRTLRNIPPNVNDDKIWKENFRFYLSDSEEN